ncbi:glycosyltransferase family 4 protein [Maricaulis sp.]|uniref:glycosyltransferase family 4 protein n=1 Tax=Maricaulis sp. TaxID=1486257 RepID=UPI001B02176F|nr:glycosyltransferase family 4 protein [Maricaulis sp.]MBO6796760.1 glycosyltransferase family 4 protein [Maricaulis sp.]
MTFETTAHSSSKMAADSDPVRPLRVLVSGYRSHPHVGGQGVYIRELTRALAGLGHKVTVISGPPYPELDDGVELIELPSLDLFEEDNAFLALRPQHLTNRADLSEWLAHNSGAFGELYSFGLRLEKYLRDHAGEYDVLHDNQTLASPFVRIDELLPVITTIHHPISIDLDYAVAAGESWWKRALTRRWYSFVKMQARTSRQLPRMLAVSAAARDSHAEHYATPTERVRVAFNGIEHSIFHPDSAVEREPGLIVTTASADAPIKGLDVLLEAVARVAAARPNVKLRIVGTLRKGPARRALEKHGLTSRVIDGGGLSREDVADLYRRAHVVACPARFEGFGFPAAEAMACGAAVVSSDGGALPEVVGDCGLVSPVGNAGAMAANLARLLDDPNMASEIGQRATARAQDVFQWKHHALAASRLYTEALAERGARS